MSKGRLKPEDEKCIQHNYMYLLDQLDARDIVNFLFQHEVIDLDDKISISSQAKRKDRNEILLDRLLNAGPGYSFNYFLKSLEGNYRFILDKLRKHAKEIDVINDLEREIKELKDEQDNERQVSRSLREKLKQQEGNLVQLKEELDSQKKHNEQLNENIVSLKEHLQGKIADNEELRREQVSLEENLQGKIADNEELRREQAQLRESLKDKESLIHSLTLDSVYKRSVLEKIKHQEVSVFMLGPTGHGKSAVGNSILQRYLFKSCDRLLTCTQTFSKETVEIHGRRVTVFDEPPHLDHSGYCFKKFLYCIKETFTANPQGFNAILYVINSKRRFGMEERKNLECSQAVFGENSLKDFCVTVFTHGDIIKCMKDICSINTLEPLMSAVSNRAVFFDNKTKNEAIRDNQVASLLAEIDILQLKQQRLYTYQDFVEQKKEHEKLLKENKT
ncbi:uncharacterized protein LOC129923466 isoform X3 [Biomphalaria glabrata]|uniref:Uncharacterized protein LOC129923466 isoform X3 n=1 Tax=Biomphalaria glabrata TaxID=6526 RepID=A0A9W2Z660_BIOGL|nr:uncharacterized protein LOC129923466 isoform X3 [Biomphalaria glabrata]